MGGPAGQNGTHPHLTYAVGSLHYPLYLTVQGGPRCGRGPATLLAIGAKSRFQGWGGSEYGGMGTDLWHRHHAPVLPSRGIKRCNYPHLYNTLQKGAASGDPHIAINTYMYHANIDMNK